MKALGVGDEERTMHFVYLPHYCTLVMWSSSSSLPLAAETAP